MPKQDALLSNAERMEGVVQYLAAHGPTTAPTLARELRCSPELLRYHVLKSSYVSRTTQPSGRGYTITTLALTPDGERYARELQHAAEAEGAAA